MSITDLEVWFSEPRLHKYRMYRNPEQAYQWNAHITKGFLVDIGHLEILLRNAVDRALSQDDRYGKHWFQNPALPLNTQAKKSVYKAVERATRRGTRPLEAGRVEEDVAYVQSLRTSIYFLASLISDSAALWIEQNSSVDEWVRKHPDANS